MTVFLGIYAGLFGLTIGSFLNVLIYRIPLKKSVVIGRSFCPNCKKDLRWIDLIPVFSFIFLRGKCRYCNDKISPRYPIVELLNTVIYLLIYSVYGIQWISLVFMVVCPCLIVLAFIDIDHGIIPDRFNLIIGICGLLLTVFSHDLPWYERAIGFFAISIPLLVLAFLTGGIGEGDVKLFAVLGLLLGWKLILLTMIMAAILASVYSVILLKQKKAEGKTQIPFGPFISLAAVFALLSGNGMLNAYLAFFIK